MLEIHAPLGCHDRLKAGYNRAIIQRPNRATNRTSSQVISSKNEEGSDIGDFADREEVGRDSPVLDFTRALRATLLSLWTKQRIQDDSAGAERQRM